MGQIMPQSWVGCLRILFGFQSSFINANQLLPFSSVFSETVVGDPIKPSRKTGFPAKAAQVLVGTEESFLSQIVRERNIRANELAEQTANTRLMIPDQLGKGVMVIIDKNTCDEVCIGKCHIPSLRQGRDFVFTTFQFPNQKVTEADHKGDNPEAPDSSFPVVDCPKEDHHP